MTIEKEKKRGSRLEARHLLEKPVAQPRLTSLQILVMMPLSRFSCTLSLKTPNMGNLG